MLGNQFLLSIPLLRTRMAAEGPSSASPGNPLQEPPPLPKAVKFCIIFFSFNFLVEFANFKIARILNGGLMETNK